MDNIGAMTDKLFELRQQKESYTNIVKDIEKEIEQYEYLIIGAMNDAGLDKVTSGKGTISKKTELYPKVIDKTVFLNFGASKNMPELFVLQANRKAFKEYFETYGEYPEGTDGTMVDKLNVRKKG